MITVYKRDLELTFEYVDLVFVFEKYVVIKKAAIHMAKLQKLIVDLNGKPIKHEEDILEQSVYFKDLWDTILSNV